ncbi:MAG: hypothetical protein ACTTJS_02600 [Wolinella sp.]
MQVGTNPYRDSDILKKYKKEAQKSGHKELSEAEKKSLNKVQERFENRFDFTKMSASELRQFTSVMTQVGQMSKEEASALLKLHGNDDNERSNILAKVKTMMETLVNSGDVGGSGFWSKILGKLQSMQGATSGINITA